MPYDYIRYKYLSIITLFILFVIFYPLNWFIFNSNYKENLDSSYIPNSETLI